ncbi:MAG: ATP phosphoribosyltransferase regulatory subunit [bacterium]|nr:ATP phosphoribosyltransferase regulatory subunit [bacterium]
MPLSAAEFAQRQHHARQLQRVSALLEDHLAQYGYARIELPLVQDAELFLTKAGDQIVTRLFTFERGGRVLALRPEFTAPAAQLYAAQFPAGTQVARWQFHGTVFEDNARSVAHFQRFTVGAELIGQHGIHADAEIMAMAVKGLTRLGIDQWVLTIGHIQLLHSLLAQFNLDQRTRRFLVTHLPQFAQGEAGAAQVTASLDTLLMGIPDGGSEVLSLSQGENNALDTHYILDVLLDATQRGETMGGRTREDIVQRLLHKRKRAAERSQIMAAVDFLKRFSVIDAPPESGFAQLRALIPADDSTSRHLLDTWQRLVGYLESYGVAQDRIRLRPALSRTWDYYTGILFEFGLPDGQQLGGGGRYDELARLVSGLIDHDLPSVGFVYYADVIAAYTQPPTARTPVMLIAHSAALKESIRWAEALRSLGADVVLTDADALPSSVHASVTDTGALGFDGQQYLFEQVEAVAHILKGWQA